MQFSKDHVFEFVAYRLNRPHADLAPNLCNLLWLELDMVPMLFPVRMTVKTLRPGLALSRTGATPGPDAQQGEPEGESLLMSVTDTLKATTLAPGTAQRPVDEQADAAVRKAVMYFGPTHNPRLSIGYKNEVEFDAAGKLHILDGLDMYRKTCREPTWNAVMHFVGDLGKRNVRLGFFSSTPQGGGVALVSVGMVLVGGGYQIPG